RSERPRVFPLCISDSIALSDCDPSVFASGKSRTLVGRLKPRNNAGRFWTVASMCFVVVRQCAVKWVLLRCKFYRDVVTSMGRIRIVETTVAFGPLFVPGARAIRNQIISTWLLSDPKDCCYDICFPRIRLRTPGTGYLSDDRLVLFCDRCGLSSSDRIKHYEE